MNVGALATIAVLNPPNLAILCVDNGHYGETGYQKSHTSLGVDLEKIAAGRRHQAHAHGEDALILPRARVSARGQRHRLCAVEGQARRPAGLQAHLDPRSAARSSARP